MSDKPLELKTAVVIHEREQGPRIVPNAFIGALDAWAQTLHDDLGAGDEEGFQAWLGTTEGAEMLRLTYAYGSRILARRAAA